MDRILAVIIIFIGLMVLMAAVLAMGAVPKIFQNAEVINETQDETKNQTEIIIKQFQRENNTTQKILNNQNKSLTNQAILIRDMQKAIEQNHFEIAQNHNLSDAILNISQEHKKVAKDHDIIQYGVSNVTNYTQKELERYGENSIKQFNQILENQEKLIELLTSLNKTKQ